MKNLTDNKTKQATPSDNLQKEDTSYGFGTEVTDVFKVQKTAEGYRQDIKDKGFFVMTFAAAMLEKGGDYEAMFPAIVGLASAAVTPEEIEKKQTSLTEEEVVKQEEKITPEQMEKQKNAFERLSNASKALLKEIFPKIDIRDKFRIPKFFDKSSNIHVDSKNDNKFDDAPQINSTLSAPGQPGTFFFSHENNHMFGADKKLKEGINPEDVKVAKVQPGQVAFFATANAASKGIEPFEQGELRGAKHTAPCKKEDLPKLLKEGSLKNESYIEGRRLAGASFVAPNYSEAVRKSQQESKGNLMGRS